MANIFSSYFLGGDDSPGFDTSQWGSYGTMAGGLLGIGGGIYSAIEGSQDAKQIAGIKKQIASQEQRENDIRRDAMVMASTRAQQETTRQAQFARSMTASIGQNQGAQLGSGVAGAYGTIGGMANTKMGAQSQALQFGLQKSQIVDQIDLLKMQEADAQAKMSGDTAFGGMLGGIGKNLGSLTQLAGLLLA